MKKKKEKNSLSYALDGGAEVQVQELPPVSSDTVNLMDHDRLVAELRVIHVTTILNVIKVQDLTQERQRKFTLYFLADQLS